MNPPTRNLTYIVRPRADATAYAASLRAQRSATAVWAEGRGRVRDGGEELPGGELLRVWERVPRACLAEVVQQVWTRPADLRHLPECLLPPVGVVRVTRLAVKLLDYGLYRQVT